VGLRVLLIAFIAFGRLLAFIVFIAFISDISTFIACAILNLTLMAGLAQIGKA
jgi:hypothetical protein